MKRSCHLVICLLLATPLFGQTRTSPPLTSLPDIIRACENRQSGIPFDITATVATPGWKRDVPLSLTDGYHCTFFGMNQSVEHLCPTNPGDIVRLQGLTITNTDGSVGADSRAVRRIGKGHLSDGHAITAQELADDSFLSKLVRAEGILRGVHQDELDVNFTFLIVNAPDGSIPVAVNANHWHYERLLELIGTHISITGIISDKTSMRRKLGRHIVAARIRSLDQRPLDDKALPLLEALVFKRPSDLLSLGRHCANGHVIAVYGGRFFLIRSSSGEFHRIEVMSGEVPRYGQHVTAFGFPSTDFYQMNLDAATWCRNNLDDHVPDEAVRKKARDIFASLPARWGANPLLQGLAISITGRISSPQPAEPGVFDLDDNGYHITVDASALESVKNQLRDGMKVEIAGTCVMDTQDWNANGTFPDIKKMLLVVRTPADVRIISQPPWLTPTMLIATICTLLFVLLAIFAWNRFLQKKIEHHGQMLLNARLDGLKSALRSQERTRLAVELHDALSQSLTGVTFQLEASQRAKNLNAAASERHFNAAMQTLQSCREELGRCLWDLRSEALEMKDFKAAIITVLNPIAQGTHIRLRFNIPREDLSDMTAHAVLRIIRELVANSVRHGHARNIRIAGDITTGALKFSVSDDGTGFDPSYAPGPSDGHFGLTGLKERVKELRGTFVLRSAIHGGTKAIVILPTPKTDPSKATPINA